MSKYFDSIYDINNNIFVFTPIILAFYKNLKPSSKNILLAYLILPMVLYEDSQRKIKNSNVRSNIFSFINNRDNKELIYGLENRIQKYKDITNKCIIYAINQKWLVINEDLSVRYLKDVENKLTNLENAYIAASKLHNIFKDFDVVTIYKYLGVKKL
jgi:hypothetical protein